MNEVWKIIDTLRGSQRSHELPPLLLMEAANKLNNLPEVSTGSLWRWDQFSKDPSYPQLQAAAQTLISLPVCERLPALSEVIENCTRGWHGMSLWLSSAATKQISELVKGPSSLRCSFGSSLHPALYAGLEARDAGRDVQISFVDEHEEVCDIAKLAASVLELNLSVFCGQPFHRADGVQADAEISLPPFGWKVSDPKMLPHRTTAWLGAAHPGRITAEPLAIADILAHAPQAQAVLCLSAGALFRTVGVEIAAREELVRTRRLRAVFDVPQGMIFQDAAITTALLIMTPEEEKSDTVRFLDLSDEHFAIRSSRGRSEIKRDTSWVDALTTLASDVGFARDVSVAEIEEQAHILTASRYLSQTAAKVAAFNERYEVRPLSELVELIRPVALPRVEDGDYLVREAAPADIGEDGLLAQPNKETKVDRGGLRKALNQQVEPGDVVVSVKGTIGRVGLVPAEAPGWDTDAFWTAGQSMMILRPKKAISSEVLYEYLSSDMMQKHLNSIAGGAAIQTINMKDLKSLPIPVPSDDEQTSIRIEFSKRMEAFEALRKMRKAIEDMRQGSWPHQDLTNGLGS